VFEARFSLVFGDLEQFSWYAVDTLAFLGQKPTNPPTAKTGNSAFHTGFWIDYSADLVIRRIWSPAPLSRA